MGLRSNTHEPTMKLTFAVLALCVLAASAYVQTPVLGSRLTTSKVASMPRAAPAMSMDSAVATLQSTSHLIADETSFGGYTFPIIGLLTLGLFIFNLSAPLEDEEV